MPEDMKETHIPAFNPGGSTQPGVTFLSLYRQETEAGSTKSSVSGRVGSRFVRSPTTCTTALCPSAAPQGLYHLQLGSDYSEVTMETCVHLGLPLLPEGPQDGGGREAGRSGSAHLPVTAAADRPSSQLAKLRPRLQATGELLGAGVGLGRALQQPGIWPQHLAPGGRSRVHQSPHGGWGALYARGGSSDPLCLPLTLQQKRVRDRGRGRGRGRPRQEEYRRTGQRALQGHNVAGETEGGQAAPGMRPASRSHLLFGARRGSDSRDPVPPPPRADAPAAELALVNPAGGAGSSSLRVAGPLAGPRPRPAPAHSEGDGPRARAQPIAVRAAYEKANGSRSPPRGAGPGAGPGGSGDSSGISKPAGCWGRPGPGPSEERGGRGQSQKQRDPGGEEGSEPKRKTSTVRFWTGPFLPPGLSLPTWVTGIWVKACFLKSNQGTLYIRITWEPLKNADFRTPRWADSDPGLKIDRPGLLINSPVRFGQWLGGQALEIPPEDPQSQPQLPWEGASWPPAGGAAGPAGHPLHPPPTRREDAAVSPGNWALERLPAPLLLFPLCSPNPGPSCSWSQGRPGRPNNKCLLSA